MVFPRRLPPSIYRLRGRQLQWEARAWLELGHRRSVRLETIEHFQGPAVFPNNQVFG